MHVALIYTNSAIILKKADKFAKYTMIFDMNITHQKISTGEQIFNFCFVLFSFLRGMRLWITKWTFKSCPINHTIKLILDDKIDKVVSFSILYFRTLRVNNLYCSIVAELCK